MGQIIVNEHDEPRSAAVRQIEEPLLAVGREAPGRDDQLHEAGVVGPFLDFLERHVDIVHCDADRAKERLACIQPVLYQHPAGGADDRLRLVRVREGGRCQQRMVDPRGPQVTGHRRRARGLIERHGELVERRSVLLAEEVGNTQVPGLPMGR